MNLKMLPIIRRFGLLVFTLLLAGPQIVCALDIIVTTKRDAVGVNGLLRQTILNASPGDTLTFAPNVAGTIGLTNGELVVAKSLSIRGPASNRIVISGNNTSRVFRVTGGSSLDISGLTIADGNSLDQGAGAYVEFGCALTLSHCAAVANISDANGGGIASNQALYTGGAIYTYARPVALRNCTVVSNSTVLADGGGLCNCSLAAGTSNYLGTTLVAGNSAPGPADVIGVFTSGGYHLIGQIDCSIPADGGAALIPTDGLTNGLNHDRVGSLASPINPLIGPLRDNGGTTPTMAPLPGSLAIDNGLSNGLSTD